MNDIQILSIATMVVSVMTGALFSNLRISDMSRRIDDMRDLLRAEMAKNHSELLHKIAELDTRVSRIEERSH